MSKKIFSIATNIVLILLGIGGFRLMNDLGDPESGLFPQLICVTMIILSILSILDMLRRKDIIIKFESLKYSVLTVLITVLYLFLWSKIGAFFILTGFYVLILFWLYLPDHKNWKKVLTVGLPVSIGSISFIWIIFYKLMFIRF